MAIDSVAALIAALRQIPLLDSAQIDQLAGQAPARLSEPRALARELLQRGWLTPYQMNQIFQGHAQELVLGQYLLLERLGEGGMGRVFKARHLHLDRVVALKLIRAEHVANQEALRRFQREIQAVSQLAHPNIVMAY